MQQDESSAPFVVEINMLGGFSMRVRDAVLSDSEVRARQVCSLLEYLVLNRKRKITQSSLIEALWGGEDCENPGNALKNLVYRLRKLLKPLSDAGNCEFIVFHGGMYSFNNDLPCIIDTEEFEKACKDSKKPGITSDEKLSCLIRAIDFYNGDLLPKAAMEDWAVPYGSYYRNMFIAGVKQAAELLIAGNRYDEALTLLNSAVPREPFDEALHEMIISALLLSGKRRKAIEYYNRTEKNFYDKLGVKLSDDLRKNMRELIKNIDSIETDLDVIRGDLGESSKSGAFLCDYEIFQKIYRIEARMTERFGQSMFVALLTLVTSVAATDESIASSMKLLEKVIIDSLRKSDIVARFSKKQYILMLPSLTYENGLMVMGRITDRFSAENKNVSVKLVTKLGPLEPSKMSS